MTASNDGVLVVYESGFDFNEGTRRYRVPICKATGSRDIAQCVNAYSFGRAPAHRNPSAEEVIYVLSGTGACHINGHRYSLAAGTAAYIPPGSIYALENTEKTEDLVTVSVSCPEEDAIQTGLEMAEAEMDDTAPLLIVREAARTPIPTGDRTFKLLVNQEQGCAAVTQFVGAIPPGGAPMHYHDYEEAIYILFGEGILHTESVDSPFQQGASIYLPRGIRHCIENTGVSPMRLLGVFHPSGSPAARYES